MKLFVLEKDWDTPISYPHQQKKGRFTGRNSEKLAIRNLISRKDSSSILIYGHRGAGKTSLLKSILHEIKKDSDTSYFPVFINGPQILKKGQVEEICPEYFLRTVITRLYRTTDYFKKDSPIEGLKKEVKSLYILAAANIFEKKNLTNLKKKDLKEYNEVRLKNFNLNDLIKPLVILIIAILAMSFTLSFKGVNSLIAQTVVLLSAIGLPTWALTSKKEESSSIKTDDTKEAELLFKFDNNISNVEFELEKVQEKFVEEGVQIIYILDEFDKISHEVFFSLIKDYKNLFTNGGAHFIFVTDKSIYDTLPKLGQSERGKNYTFFNSTFFISRPSPKDIESFINEIFHSEKSEISISCKNELIDSLIFRAKGDFFDLMRTIQNHINHYVDGHPCIGFDNEFARKVKSRSNLYRAIKLIYSEKYESPHKAKWIQNEKILLALYEFSHQIKDWDLRGDVSDFSVEDSYIVSSAKQDLGILFERLGYISRSREEVIKVHGQDYTKTFFISTEDFSAEVPDTLGFLSQWEIDFMNETYNFLETCKRALTLVNLILPKDRSIPLEITEEDEKKVRSYLKYLNQNLIIKNVESIVSVISTIKELQKDNPKTYKNAEIESFRTVVQSEENRINNSWFQILASAISKAFAVKGVAIQKTQVNSQYINSREFLRDLDEEFKNRIVHLPNMLITRNTGRKSILILQESVNQTLEGIQDIYRHDKDKHESISLEVIVIGRNLEKLSNSFKAIDVAFGFEDQNLETIIHGIIDRFCSQR